MTFAPDYVDVAQRIREFREKHPDGSLQPLNLEKPFIVTEVGGKTFVVYVAAAYRTPDDQRPGVGVAWEPFPGPTAFTKDSELMNAETSAWGRAIVAALAADTKKVASADEVQARSGGAPPVPRDAARGAPPAANLATVKQRGFIQRLVDKTGMVPETWPLPDTLTKAEAAKLIDWLQDTPVEPPAERVATLRKELGAVEDEFVGGGA